jgi:hypothetical protein
MDKLPDLLQPYLASYNLRELSIRKDKELIITSILNKGDQKALDWLAKTYTRKEILNIVKKPKKGFWHKDVLQYWLRIFGIKLSKPDFRKSLIQF